jgi:hypothetical protein
MMVNVTLLQLAVGLLLTSLSSMVFVFVVGALYPPKREFYTDMLVGPGVRLFNDGKEIEVPSPNKAHYVRIEFEQSV